MEPDGRLETDLPTGGRLDCYWVGSLDCNFLGKLLVFHRAHKQFNFLQRVQQQPKQDLHSLPSYFVAHVRDAAMRSYPKRGAGAADSAIFQTVAEPGGLHGLAAVLVQSERQLDQGEGAQVLSGKEGC